MKKTEGRKSRWTVPLKRLCYKKLGIISYCTSCCFRSKPETANWFLHFFCQLSNINASHIFFWIKRKLWHPGANSQSFLHKIFDFYISFNSQLALFIYNFSFSFKGFIFNPHIKDIYGKTWTIIVKMLIELN